MTFPDDGDGNRVKKEEGGVVTHYPGRHLDGIMKLPLDPAPPNITMPMDS